MKKNRTQYDKERAEILGPKLNVLIRFANELIEDIDILEDLVEMTQERLSFVSSAEVILAAFGKDTNEIQFKKDCEMQRAEALLNFVKVLQKTEKEMKEFQRENKQRLEASSELDKVLGL